MIRICSKAVFFSLILALLSAGCGDASPKLYPVTGTLTVKGKPAENAIVFMHRVGRTDIAEPVPYGTVDAGGQYKIVTPFDRSGAQEGEYVLAVFYPDMSKAPDGSGQRPDLLRGAHDKPGASKLKATVKPAANTIAPIDLTPGAPSQRKPVANHNNK
jgi:hypothetical protein